MQAAVADELLGEKDLPVLFHVSALVQRGRLAADLAASPGEFEDYRFTYAKKLLDGCQAVKPIHPLAAYIAENHADEPSWTNGRSMKRASSSRRRITFA